MTDWSRVTRAVYRVRQHYRYTYSAPVWDIKQRLMMIPPEAGGDQRVLEHDLRVRGHEGDIEVRWIRDEYGNRVANLRVARVQHAIDFEAIFQVERDSTRASAPRSAPWLAFGGPSRFVHHTALTAPDERLWRAADEIHRSARGDPRECAERAHDWTARSITYQYGVTGYTTPAAMALHFGKGVCQDFAHIMLTVLRLLRIPCRYVSGHMLGEGAPHAWVEVLFEDEDVAGRVEVIAYDPTHHRRARMDYITIATGRDFADIKRSSAREARVHQAGAGGGAERAGAPERRVITQSSPLATYDPTAFWDEMFSAPGVVRPHYAKLARRLETLSAEEVTRRQRAADLSFQARGITFAVNQDPSGVEKIMPFDLIPRIILPEEWDRIERGLEQRVRALNLFLHDVYHDGKILRSGLIPPELILGSSGYRREVRSVEPPLGVYTHVVGSDLVRDHRGEFFVLEDNLRVPSGVSYVVENRRVLKRVWPQIFADYPIRPVEGYPQDLLSVLREVAPPIAEAPTVVLLTPGVHNSAFFEHAFLAKAMGIEMVQGSDLFVDDGTVYMRTTSGRQRVDVIYRRVDDDFLDPLAFRRDSFLGVPGLLATYRMGRIALANALGTGVADDKAIYAYVPTIIKYYLGEDEIIPNVKTYIAADPTERAYILEHIAELVVKSVNASGGYGMLIGPHAPKADHEEYRRRIQADPRGFIAQPTIALSRHPSWSQRSLEGRHVDLRPYVLFGKEVRVTPGGLTRVALRAGSLVVNSSQGGGAKDTWVLG